MNCSYGLFVPEILNFPIEIIADAKQKAKELEKFKDQYDEDIKANQDDDALSELLNAIKNYKNGDDDNLLFMAKKILFDSKKS